MARTPVPPEIKAKAIADLLTGDQPVDVARRYNLPGGTVRQWKNRLVTPDVTQSVTPPVTANVRAVIHRPTVDTRQMELGELVMLNLRAKLIATQRIAEYVTSPEWLAKQSADVAALFTVLDQSATAILDRLSRHATRDDPIDTDSDAA